MLDLMIDNQALEELGKRIGGTEAQILEARNRALAALQKEVEISARRTAAGVAKIPQRLLKSRIRRGEKSHHGDDEMRVWLGARDVDPTRLGKPTAYGNPPRPGGGVRVAGRNWPGAFLGRVYSRSRANVWIRVRSRHYRPELYPHKYVGGDRGGKSSRFPVVRAMVRLYAELAQAAERVRAMLVPRFNEEFSKQLRAIVLRG